MNKNECKKYIKRACIKLIYKSKPITPESISKEMEKEIQSDGKLYISYAKVATHMLNTSATEITANQLVEQIDVIPKIYNEIEVLTKANII